MDIFSKTEMNVVIFPLLNKLIKNYRKDKTSIIGIQGGQGTGKTTLVNLLVSLLRSKGYRTQSFSLDNFYLSLAGRRRLGQRYPNNVFYQIPRGMPGTHRIAALRRTLLAIKSGQPFQIPVFDKSLSQGEGDISGKPVMAMERPDFVLIEGWCLGLPEFSLTELHRICRKNQINLQKLDPRGHSTKVLLDYTHKYRGLWKLIDYWIQLKPDLPSLHLKWRMQQEQGLQERKGAGMSPEQIKHFVSVFLPLTYICYEKLRPNLRLRINVAHQFYRMDELKKKIKNNFK